MGGGGGVRRGASEVFDQRGIPLLPNGRARANGGACRGSS